MIGPARGLSGAFYPHRQTESQSQSHKHALVYLGNLLLYSTLEALGTDASRDAEVRVPRDIGKPGT